MLSFTLRVSAAASWTGESRHARTKNVEEITQVFQWAIDNNAREVFLHKADNDTSDLYNWALLREQFHTFPDRAILLEPEHLAALVHGDATKLERQLERLFRAYRAMSTALEDTDSGEEDDAVVCSVCGKVNAYTLCEDCGW